MFESKHCKHNISSFPVAMYGGTGSFVNDTSVIVCGGQLLFNGSVSEKGLFLKKDTAHYSTRAFPYSIQITRWKNYDPQKNISRWRKVPNQFFLDPLFWTRAEF